MKRPWKIGFGMLLLFVLVASAGGQVMAGEGDWLVRGRLLNVMPDASGDGTLEGMDVGDNITAEVDVTYFFTERWAVELIVATTSNEITLPSEGTEFNLGSASLLPPTVLVQYHFLPDGRVRPYIGAGINYTIFYNQSGLLDELDDLDNSFGLAAQAGIDFMLNDTMSFNVDLKYIKLDTDVSDAGTKLGTLTIDPWILGLGFGWRF